MVPYKSLPLLLEMPRRIILNPANTQLLGLERRTSALMLRRLNYRKLCQKPFLVLTTPRLTVTVAP
eukprot:1100690-Pyramimonas_sp.AAC.1